MPKIAIGITAFVLDDGIKELYWVPSKYFGLIFFLYFDKAE